MAMSVNSVSIVASQSVYGLFSHKSLYEYDDHNAKIHPSPPPLAGEEADSTTNQVIAFSLSLPPGDNQSLAAFFAT